LVFEQEMREFVGDVRPASLGCVGCVLDDELTGSDRDQCGRPDLGSVGLEVRDRLGGAACGVEVFESVDVDAVFAREVVRAEALVFGELDVISADGDSAATDFRFGKPLVHGSPVPVSAVGAVQVHGRCEHVL